MFGDVYGYHYVMNQLGAEVQASTAVDPAINMIRTRLGVDELEAQDLARIQVSCPVPGMDRISSLGEFMVSEHGADMATTILDLASEAHSEGATPEQSISRALGFSAMKDKETGSLLRVPTRETSPAVEQATTDSAVTEQKTVEEAPKKKLTQLPSRQLQS